MVDLAARNPINLMIVGAQKAGTTSLLRYLGDHPGICTHSQVEMTFFVHEDEYQLGYSRIFPRYFSLDEDSSPIILAKSVSVMILPEAIARLYKHNPDAQLVVMLRNPVDRAYSHYWYSRRRGWEDRETFEEAIASDLATRADIQVGNVNRNYLSNGLYINHLQQLMKVFPPEQIQIILLEDLKEDPLRVCRSIYSLFPQLDPAYNPVIRQTHNISAAYRSRSLALLTSSRTTLPAIKKIARTLMPDRTMDYLRDFIRNANEQEFKPPPMQPETRTRLLAFFQPFNQNLGELIGRDLTHWNNQKKS